MGTTQLHVHHMTSFGIHLLTDFHPSSIQRTNKLPDANTVLPNFDQSHPSRYWYDLMSLVR